MGTNITTSQKTTSHVTLTDISSAVSCNKGNTLFKNAAKKKGKRERKKIKEVFHKTGKAFHNPVTKFTKRSTKVKAKTCMVKYLVKTYDE